MNSIRKTEEARPSLKFSHVKIINATVLKLLTVRHTGAAGGADAAAPPPAKPALSRSNSAGGRRQLPGGPTTGVEAQTIGWDGGARSALSMRPTAIYEEMLKGCREADAALWNMASVPVANARRLAMSLILAEAAPHTLGTVALCYAFETKEKGVLIAQHLVSEARDRVITDMLLDELRQNHGKLFHNLVREAEWASVVGQVARVHRSLPELRDAEGRRAYDQAVQVTRAAIDDAVFFCGRFRLGEKLHESSTCVVCKSEDVRTVGGGSGGGMRGAQHRHGR